MLMISSQLDFVKRQTEYNQRQYLRLLEKSTQADNPAAAQRAEVKLPLYERLSSGFQDLLTAMESDIQTWEMFSQSPNTGTQVSGLSDLDDLLRTPIEIQQQTLAGLPEDLIAQLQISDSDRFQWSVVDIINRTPEKMISLEVLLIALYRLSGKIYERADLANRMSRLSRKGVAFPVQGRKAVYTTIPPAEMGLEPEDVEMFS